MSDSEDRSFLGRGWSFPPTFTWSSKSVEMVHEDEDIEQSLFILLSTIPGERIMRPKYGCDLHSMVFSGRNDETMQRIKDLVSTSVLMNEPRVVVENIDVYLDSMDPMGLVKVSLIYTIIKTNTRSNIVYPFYIIEGTLVNAV